MTLPDRFFDKLSVDYNGCWVWLACVNDAGYGIFRLNNRNYRAHVLMFEYFIGPVPAGLVLDHKCRNRECANPDHVEPVTRGENVRRGLPFRLPLEFCKNGHARTPDNINKFGRCITCRRRTALAYFHRKVAV